MWQEYTVDISKPPIGPPHREFKMPWGIETKESKKAAARYNSYLKKYNKALMQRQLNEKSSSL